MIGMERKGKSIMDGIEADRRQVSMGRASMVAISLTTVLIIVSATIGIAFSRRDNVQPIGRSLDILDAVSDAPSLSPTINNIASDRCGSSSSKCLPNMTSTLSILIHPYMETELSTDDGEQTWSNVTLQYLVNNSDCDEVDISYQRRSMLFTTNDTNTTNEQVLLVEFEVSNMCLRDAVEWDPSSNATDSTFALILQSIPNISDYFAFVRMDQYELQVEDSIRFYYKQQDSNIILPTASPTTAPLSITLWGSFEELEMVPHDSEAFTQGLEMVPGNPYRYFESTGMYGGSSIRRVDLGTGTVLVKHELSEEYFAEGLTYYLDKDGNERLLQLTWREGVVFQYDAQTLQVLEEIRVDSTTNGEGWGICFVPNEDIFYVSDGTHYLHKWNTSTLELIDKIPVTYRETVGDIVPLEQNKLNELEYDVHSGTILSNVWLQNYIVRIDPATGFITHRYDLTPLDRHDNADVLNGIAITDIPNEIWVTGKYWPAMHRIRLMD